MNILDAAKMMFPTSDMVLSEAEMLEWRHTPKELENIDDEKQKLKQNGFVFGGSFVALKAMRWLTDNANKYIQHGEMDDEFITDFIKAMAR